MWIRSRKYQRSGPHESILAGANGNRRNILCLSCNGVEAGAFAAVNEVRMQRIGRHVAVLFGSHGMPVTKRDFPPIAPARCAGRAALLLASVNPIGQLIVRDDMKELRG